LQLGQFIRYTKTLFKNPGVGMKLNKLFKAGPWGDGLAIVSGVLITLAFAPFNVTPLAILAPALLLALWLKVKKGRAFFRGWLFGLGYFGSGVYWVYISIHTYGMSPVWLSAFITIGLINILALFPAFTGYLLTRYFPNNNRTKLLCAFPVIWCFLEWLRGVLFTGFPWLSLGYSQINTPLKGYAPLVGVYGVSLIMVISSGLLLDTALNLRARKNVMLAYQSLFWLVFIWVIGGFFSYANWTTPAGAPVKVSLVQGNIPQELKWNPAHVQPTLDEYSKLTREHWDSAIIVWPEGAVPITIQEAQDFLTRLSIEAALHKTTIITGIPMMAHPWGGYYNGVAAIGNGKGLYFKHRLVPFGEYVPFDAYLHHFLNILHIVMSDFIPGTENFEPLWASGHYIAAYICYEIAYPQQVAASYRGSGILLTVSDDAWFGESIAQPQHLQIAQMRALELGRPLLFVSNNGITAIINAKGRIQSRIPAFETGVLTDNVQAYKGTTPWEICGMNTFFIALMIMLIMSIRKKHLTE
jgi:apolipoprotein N-acyltransferase